MAEKTHCVEPCGDCLLPLMEESRRIDDARVVINSVFKRRTPKEVRSLLNTGRGMGVLEGFMGDTMLSNGIPSFTPRDEALINGTVDTIASGDCDNN